MSLSEETINLETPNSQLVSVQNTQGDTPSIVAGKGGGLTAEDLRDTAAKFKIPLDEMVQKLADSGFSVKLMPTPVPVPLPRPQPKKPESEQEFDVAAVDDTAPVAPNGCPIAIAPPFTLVIE